MRGCKLKMKKIKLKIEGMHCASCASNIEKSLKKIPGIKTASVSLMMKKGFVEAEDSVKDEDVQKAVSKVGYKLVGIERE